MGDRTALSKRPEEEIESTQGCVVIGNKPMGFIIPATVRLCCIHHFTLLT